MHINAVNQRQWQLITDKSRHFDLYHNMHTPVHYVHIVGHTILFEIKYCTTEGGNNNIV